MFDDLSFFNLVVVHRLQKLHSHSRGFLHGGIDLTHKVRNCDQHLILVEQRAAEQRDQEHDDGNDGHRRASDNGNGGHAVAVFLFLDLLPGLSAGLLSIGAAAADTIGRNRSAGAGLGSGDISGGAALAFRRPGTLAGGCGGVGTLGSRGNACYPLCRGPGLPCRLRHHFRSLDHLGGIVHGSSVLTKEDRRIFPEFLHILQHFRGGEVTVLGIQGHGLHDDLLHAAGNVGVQGRGHGGAAVDMLNGHSHGRLAVIRRPACHHLVHHDAQGIQVGPVVHPAALGLLGRNIVNAAQGFLGQCIALAHDPGNAKVGDFHGTIFQHHHVMGLDIPMDDAPAMGVLQGLGDLHAEVESLLPVEGPLLLHVLLQRDAVDQLHHNIIRIIGGGNVIHLHDIGMAQHGNSFTLRVEAAAELLIPGKFVF